MKSPQDFAVGGPGIAARWTSSAGFVGQSDGYSQLSRHPHPQRMPIRLELAAPAMVRRGVNDWQKPTDSQMRQTAFGTHVLDIDATTCKLDDTIKFTFLWLGELRWENTDFAVRIVMA